MDRTISVDELVASLPEILERVRRGGERFVVERAGTPIATIGPPIPRGVTIGELVAKLGDLRMPDPEFAEDLARINAEQPPLPDIPWR